MKAFGPNNRYEVAKKLGSGTLGVCYRVRDTQTDDVVVLKVLSEASKANPSATQQLEAEIDAQSGFGSPLLAQFLSVVTDEKTLGVTRPFVDAPTLAEVVESMPREQAISFVDAVMDGVSSAHESGVSHLGLNANNIFVVGNAPDRTPCITDFGIPRIVGDAAYSDTYGDRMCLAPEQRSEAPAPDYRADIYSLGCLLTVVLTGRRDPQHLRNHDNGSEGDSPELSPELTRVINIATARDPTRRYANVLALRVAFRQALSESGIELSELSSEEEEEEEEVILESTEIEFLDLDEIEDVVELETETSHRPPLPSGALSGNRPAVPFDSASLPSVDSWLTAFDGNVAARDADNKSTERPAPQLQNDESSAGSEKPPFERAMTRPALGVRAMVSDTPTSPQTAAPEAGPESVASFEEAIEIDLASGGFEATRTPNAKDESVGRLAGEAMRQRESGDRLSSPSSDGPVGGIEHGGPRGVVVALVLIALVVGVVAGFLLGQSSSVDDVEAVAQPVDETVGEETPATEEPTPAPNPATETDSATEEEPPTEVAASEVDPEPEEIAAPVEGPLVFDDSLWQVDNSWLFHYRRDVPEGAPSFLNLQFYFSRRITEVSPHEWGSRVVVTDEGGISEPRSTVYIASASCLLDPGDREVLFCLPLTEQNLLERTVADTPVRVLEATVADRNIRFDPGLGWVGESETDRDGQLIESTLVGYRIGERSGGEPDLSTPTCDWTATFDRGSRLGNANRPRTPEMERARSWGLRRIVRRIDVPVSTGADISRLTAWHDDAKTVYVLSETPLEVGEVPEEEVPLEQIDLALDGVKTWVASDGSAEYIALIYESDDNAQVQLLRITAGNPIETHTLMPISEASGLAVVLLANDQGCYVQIRNGYREEQRFANFNLTPDGVVRTAGDIEVPNP